MRLCKDCKYADFSSKHPVCLAAPVEISPVTGEPKAGVNWCDVQRGYDLPSLCAPRGRWFEAKEIAA